jgi:hypothetical protein
MEEMFKESVDGTLNLIIQQQVQIDHIHLKAKVLLGPCDVPSTTNTETRQFSSPEDFLVMSTSFEEFVS